MSRPITRPAFLIAIAVMTLLPGLAPLAAGGEGEPATGGWRPFSPGPDGPALIAAGTQSRSDESWESDLGLELAWDSDEWVETDRANDITDQSLTLRSEDDMVLLLQALMGYGGDPEACLNDVVGYYLESFDTAEAAPDYLSEAIGPDPDALYGVFTFSSEEIGIDEGVVYFGCLEVVAGQSVVAFIALGEADQAEDGLEAADALLDDGLTLDGDPVDTSDLSERVEFLATDIDRFYTRALRLDDATYEAPTYEGFDLPTESACYSAPDEGSSDDFGTNLLVPGDGPVYCGANLTVLVDLPWLDTFLVSEGGDAIVASILAHEAGHHVQALLGLDADYDGSDPKDVFVSEQQADCFSGSYLRSAVLRGIYTEEDIDNVTDVFDQISGYEEGLDHGTGEERIAALMLGYEGGFDACGVSD